MQKISTCLWFDANGQDAVDFYIGIFKDSCIRGVSRYPETSAAMLGKTVGSVMTVVFELAGQEFLALNGGTHCKPNPSISLSVDCETEEEIDRLYNYLSKGGADLMPLQQYPFSKKYCWINDKFGVSWQLNFTGRAQKITPCFMFVGEMAGRAEEAMRFWSEQFDQSEVTQVVHYEPGDGDKENLVKRGFFKLAGEDLLAMDSSHPHAFGFTPGVSLIVNCLRQSEIDSMWEKLGAGGRPGQCGWLEDRFGVSWQIVPRALGDLLLKATPEQTDAIFVELHKMTKLDEAALENAYKSRAGV